VSVDIRHKKKIISVVIVTCNAIELLAKCLASLREGVEYSLEMIIIDNGSRDGTADMVRKEYPQAILIKNIKNRGVAPARNQGLRIARGDFIMILDDDAYVEPGTLERFISFMEHNTAVGLCGPRIIDGLGQLTTSCKRFPTPFSFLLNRYPQFTIIDKNNALSKHLMLDWDHKNMVPVDYVIGACQFIRRGAFLAVGFLDDKIFYGPEDIDYCVRMWMGGWKVFYVPAIVAVHTPRRITKRKIVSQLTWRHFMAIQHFFRKYRLRTLKEMSRANDRFVSATSKRR
jgi:N-acetylglucosaminyl-diphospho-decaprenol L-rhamnosyltransferase